MANYIISYDLNGSNPTHATMDKHLGAAGYIRGRILETVWYVRSDQSATAIFDYVNSILSSNDRLAVVAASHGKVRNLLVPIEQLIEAWE